ncbi:MAG: HlyD family efflux transporter periplasmic adaptor subunit, partial [Bacteroidetes bacterium]|nr:HlyD family efflux transporter periplasmic adaptor subunit [Bacteroidota bacterium]
LTYCTIRSPINGEVIQRNVDQGQTVAATLQSPTLFTIAEDLTRIQVEVDVSEADIGCVKAGQSVEFNVDAFPEHRFTAVVQQVRNFATNMHNVVTYKVIANVNNDQLLLRPGMTANAAILVSTADDTLFIPNAAFRYKPAPSSAPTKGQSKGHRRVNIYVLKGGMPTTVPVTIGITDDICTQIISGGVALGDEVIIGIKPADNDRSALKTRLFSSLKPKGN